jgi:hypothetical protein
MQNDFLVGIPEQRLIRYFGSDNDITIPRDIVILGKYCLSECSSLTSVSFADGSKLKEIEHCAIFGTDLSMFHIPASVERICGSAFGGCTTRRITVDEGNLQFRIDGEFLVDWDGRELIRYFGGSSRVFIEEGIEVLSFGCFYGHPHVVHCDLSDRSRLRSVKAKAFWNCPILDITLPSCVCDIERRAFLSSCHVSIRGLSGEEEDRFRKWEWQHKSDPSVVLNLQSE